MATLNFPDSPDTGDTYSDANSGFEYEWNGTVWISRDASTSGKRSNIQEIDDISSGFDGSTTAFTLNVASRAIEPTDAQQLVISVGGVLQNSGDDYTIVGSTITFTTAPADGLTFFGTYLNPYLSSNTVSDNTVSPSSLAASGNYTVGGINVTGVSTLTGLTYTGISSISNLSSSNLAVTGVGTIANVIHTKDSSGLGATIGAAVGIVTYYGDASNMTGIGMSLFPYTYSPASGGSSIDPDSDIITTWNTSLEAGSGTITIRTGSSSGTVVDQFVVGTSNSITIAGNSLTLNPAANLSYGTQYFVVYPAGTIKALGGQHQNKQLVTSFTTRTLNREAWFWGQGNDGQNALNNTTHYSSPTQLPGTTWEYIVTHNDTGHATKTDGTLWSWGVNANGNLGLNQASGAYSSPIQVGTDTTWNKIAVLYKGGDQMSSIKDDGTFWTWGGGFYGSMGINLNNPRRSSPTQVGTETTWKQVSIAQYWQLATKTDGTLWEWGNGTEGQLGQNDRTDRSSPVQIPGTSWAHSQVGQGFGLAVRTDGTLWAWGENTNGKLGQNASVNAHKSSPTQIPGTTWASGEFQLATAANSVASIKTDGTLWVWGESGSWNILGLNSPQHSHVSSPTQLPGTDWSSISYTYTSQFRAIKTDGSMWNWGRNGYGSLGQNQNPSDLQGFSSPTQVPGTTWASGGAGLFQRRDV